MTAPCPSCGAPSWNSAIHRGDSCLPCKRQQHERVHEPTIVDGELDCSGCDWSPWGPVSWSAHVDPDPSFVETAVPFSADDAARLYLRQLRKSRPSPAVLAVVEQFEDELRARAPREVDAE